MLALLCAAIVASACPAPEPGTQQRTAEGTHAQILSTATISDPKTFNPLLASDPASSAAVGALFDSLLRLDPLTERVEPFLATRWESNADGTEYRFFLRRNVRWHDGEPLTATDVEFTFEAIYDDRTSSTLRQILTVDGQPIDVEAVDDHVVVVRVPRPYAPLLYSLAVPIVPRHVLGEALDAGTFARQWGIDTPPERLIGSGPYRMVRYEPGRAIELERNPDYWMRDEAGARLPYLRGWVIHIVPDADAAHARFLARQTDIYNPRLHEVTDLRARASTLGVRVEAIGFDPGTLFLAFNRNPLRNRDQGGGDPRLGWFQDKNFLRAIAHGIDKQAIVDQAMHGLGQAAVSHLSPENDLFDAAPLRDHAYDLAEARRLLREGGYVDRNGDGTIEDQAGNPVAFSLATNAGNPMREKICSLLADAWAKLGMKVSPRPLEFPLLVEKLDTTFEWDAILMGFTGSIEPDAASSLLRSNGKLHVWHPNQPSPATDWEAEIDRLLDAASRELDPAGRAGLYLRIHEILHEELPIIPLAREMRFAAFSAGLENFRATAWGVHRPERLRFSK
jgi:peptide/nickel transport system substrate-binding protein